MNVAAKIMAGYIFAQAYASAVTPAVVAPTSSVVSESVAWVAAQPATPEWDVPYTRSQWPHWIDSDKDCQNTRVEVIVRASDTTSATDCTMTHGKWIDPYTGQIFTDSTLLDVDHVVPLKEAAQSGGQSWPTEKKQAFANDLSLNPTQLLAVSASANRQKGAKDIAEWLPKEGVCDYVQNWVGVKRKWGLSMDKAEKAKILSVLDRC